MYLVSNQLLQLVYFGRGEFTIVTAFETLELQEGEALADEMLHGMTDSFAHAAHLAVTSFVDDEFDARFAFFVCGEEFHFGWGGESVFPGRAFHHAAKLVEAKRTKVLPNTVLLKENRAAVIEFDGESDHAEERCKKDQPTECADEIE